MKKFLSSLYKSISGKVGLLSAVLLSFVFIIITYSIIQVSTIRTEMQEMASIDLPLSEVVNDIEMLVLNQRLIIRTLLSWKQADTSVTALSARALITKNEHVQINLQHDLNKASLILANSISSHLVRDDLQKHQQTQHKLQQLQQKQIAFKQLLSATLKNVALAKLSTKHWQQVEESFNEVDGLVNTVLSQISSLLDDVALKTEKHIDRFFWVNVYLGVSALIIGLYITVYTMRFIHNRLRYIHSQLSQAKTAGQSKEASSTQASSTQEGIFTVDDELSMLSKHIQNVINDFETELTSRREIEKSLLKLAVTDNLTGAYNRHKWEEMIDLEISMLTRGNSFSVIHLDLDHFKAINDTHGHAIGDLVLQHAVNLIKQQIRQSDAVFRMGGEEFTILLRKADIKHAMEVAEKIRFVFEDCSVEGLPKFTASFGVTQSQQDESETSLLKRVDTALYKAKNSGRNKIVESESSPHK